MPKFIVRYTSIIDVELDTDDLSTVAYVMRDLTEFDSVLDPEEYREWDDPEVVKTARRLANNSAAWNRDAIEVR